IQHAPRQPLIFRRFRMQRIASQQRIANRGKADPVTIVYVLFALDWVRFQSIEDLVFAFVKIGLAGFLQVQLDYDFILHGVAIALDRGVVQSHLVQIAANRADVRGIHKLHVDQGAATEIHAQRNAVPEQHGKNASHAEDQREAEEVPLFTKKIDICIAKKFHCVLTFCQMLKASPRPLRLSTASKITRETKTAVNRLAKRPKISVRPNPLTGPVPTKNKISAETMVVTWVSRIVVQARSKPWSTAAAAALPLRNS